MLCERADRIVSLILRTDLGICVFTNLCFDRLGIVERDFRCGLLRLVELSLRYLSSSLFRWFSCYQVHPHWLWYEFRFGTCYEVCWQCYANHWYDSYGRSVIAKNYLLAWYGHFQLFNRLWHRWCGKMVVLDNSRVQILVFCTPNFERIIFVACIEFKELRLLDVWLIVEIESPGRIVLFLVNILETGCSLKLRSDHSPPLYQTPVTKSFIPCPYLF